LIAGDVISLTAGTRERGTPTHRQSTYRKQKYIRIVVTPKMYNTFKIKDKINCEWYNAHCFSPCLRCRGHQRRHFTFSRWWNFPIRGIYLNFADLNRHIIRDKASLQPMDRRTLNIWIACYIRKELDVMEITLILGLVLGGSLYYNNVHPNYM
jgi:hypothetical protein